jgi:hypothetical protein
MFYTQKVPNVYSLPDGPPIFHPPFPAWLWSHRDELPHPLPEMDDHQLSTPNNGPSTYPLQIPSIRTNPCALPINYSSSTDSHVEPPHVNVEASTIFRSSTPVLVGAPQEHLDNITRAPTQSSRPADLQFHLPREPVCRYNRPGKEPAAEFEPNPVKLRESCERNGGSAFAVDWTLVVFKHGVNKEALLRSLNRSEIGRMHFRGGFVPRQAYDGFISKIGDRFECGLCEEGERTCWKNKKDAPRHLRKFHFGLGDPCNIWCVRWCAPYWVYWNPEYLFSFTVVKAFIPVAK